MTPGPDAPPPPTPPAGAPDDWAAVQHWFGLALAQPPARRTAWLQAQALPPAVAAEVLSLLAHATGGSEDDPGFLATPVSADALQRPGAAADRSGERLGAWVLEALAGAGGMGEVYRARRADGQYDGLAAVKVLRRGLDSAQVLGRFAQEQQALARLDHPNIAHLLDAGRTVDGQPYFVMRWVDGVPIDRACAGRPLTERLGWFLQLADAVSHAHRHLLVHRDLKPGNVLVTTEGQVQLLDFGIAKALDPLEGGDAGRTQQGERPFTPHYASPEQVRGEPVSTATDIYSLGVLLYVMLTGIRPYGREASTPYEAARSVLQEQPTRPSALTPQQVSEPNWLATRRRLAGDLDNILLKALAKPQAERYASVDALAADVRAHLAGRPVSARAATPAYLIGRFVRRHRATVGAGALAVLALAGGLAGTAWQARRAEQARAAAELRLQQVQELAHRLLFDYHDQIHLLPGSTAVREAMLRDARAYLQTLTPAAGAEVPTPLVRELGVAHRRLAELYDAEARPALGGVQASLALNDTAVRLLHEAAAREPAVPFGRYQLALALAARASSLQSLGRWADALAPLVESQTLFDTLAREAPREVAYRVEAVRADLRLSQVHGGAGSVGLADAAAASRHLARAAQAVGPLRADFPDDTDVLALTASVINLRWLEALDAGRVDDGLAMLRGLAPVFQRLLALQPANTLFARDAAVNLLSQGTALTRLGRHAEALAASQEALRRMQALAAQDAVNRSIRRDVAKLQTDVAGSLLRLRRAADAQAPLDSALAAYQALVAADADDRRTARGQVLAQALAAQVAAARGQAAAAQRHAAQAQAGVAALRGAADDAPGLWLAAQVRWQLAQAFEGQPAAACAHHRAADAAWAALRQRGALRPLDLPRADDSRAAAAACGTG